MNGRQFLIVVAGAALAMAPARAQGLQRRAVVPGGGNPEHGSCSGEVMVDGTAEVNVRGDTATARDISGRPPEIRRFECTSPMPANFDIQFNGEGRGRIRMIRSPRDNNGAAVIRIEDSEGGANPYRFQLSWDNRGPSPVGGGGYGAGVPPVNGRFGTENGRFGTENGRFGTENGRFGADQAVQVCQDAIRRQAGERFGARQVIFRRINMDDNPGRNDWVVGMMEIRRPDGIEEHRRFSCSVNFENGRVRSADIESPEGNGYREGGYREGGADRDMTAREMQACRDAVGDRIRGDGYDRIDFGDMNMANRYGNDLITGTARARGGYQPQSFTFSCSMTPGSNYVRSTDVRKR
jgi:hypothetical protein